MTAESVPHDSVLVVIDVQNGFVNDRSAHVVPAVAAVVDRWTAAGGSVIFTRFYNAAGSPYETIIGWTKLRLDEEIAIVDELKPYTDRDGVYLLDKPIYSLFTEEGASLLEAGGWANLYFCGIATESCVGKSAVDAFERGYVPWVLVDATGSHAGPEAHQAGLLTTGRNIGKRQLITAAELPWSTSITS